MSNQSTSEADMGYVRDFVQKIAEALVSATELPKQIAAIQQDMTSLSSDLERTKARNIELDALVSDIRRQRDEAEQKLSEVKATLSNLTHNYDKIVSDAKAKSDEVERLHSELIKAKTERDDYGLQHMEAEERAKTAEAKLAKLADALGLPKAGQTETNPPQAEQAIPNSPKRVYEGDYGFNELPYSSEVFDSSLGLYYRTA